MLIGGYSFVSCFGNSFGGFTIHVYAKAIWYDADYSWYKASFFVWYVTVDLWIQEQLKYILNKNH